MSRPGRPALTSLVLSVSGRCNLACRFCYERTGRLAAEPTAADLAALLRRHDPATVRNVMFMAGETLLRPDAVDLVRQTRDLGFRGIGLATNGTTLRSEAQVEALLDAGLEGIEVSIHTWDDARAADLSGRAFTPSRQRLALALLADAAQRRPLTVILNTVLCAENVGDVPALIAAVEARHPALRPRYHLKVPMGLARARATVRPAPLAAIRAMIADLPGQIRRRIGIDDAPLCVLADRLSLASNLFSALGEARTTYATPGSGHELITADGLRSDRGRFAPACAACTARPLCPGLQPEALADPEDQAALRPFAEPAVDLATRATGRGSAALGRRVARLVSDRGGPEPDRPVAPTLGEALAEARRRFGPLAPVLPEVLAVQAGLLPAVALNPAGADAARLAALEDWARSMPGVALRVDDAGRAWLLRRDGGGRTWAGPPACCARAAYPPPGPGSWLLNPYLRDTPFHLIGHWPCRLDCPASRDRASALLAVLARRAPWLHARVRRFGRGIALAAPDGDFLWLEGEASGDGWTYHAAHRRADLAAWAGREAVRDPGLDALARALPAGNHLTLDGPAWTVRREGAPVARGRTLDVRVTEFK